MVKTLGRVHPNYENKAAPGKSRVVPVRCYFYILWSVCFLAVCVRTYLLAITALQTCYFSRIGAWISRHCKEGKAILRSGALEIAAEEEEEAQKVGREGGIRLPPPPPPPSAAPPMSPAGGDTK